MASTFIVNGSVGVGVASRNGTATVGRITTGGANVGIGVGVAVGSGVGVAVGMAVGWGV